MAERSIADVVVIGAGIAGVGAAWALSADQQVLLIEQESQPGTHATGRSAAVISETSGRFEVCALAARSRPFLTEPPSSVTERPLLTPRGLLWVSDAPQVHRLDEIAAIAAGLGVPHRRLRPSEVVQLVPEIRPSWVSAGLYEPDAMSIDVAELMRGWLADFKRRGGRLLTTTEAVELTPLASGWLVISPHRRIHCNVVVNAAGAWADVVAERAGLDPIGLQPLRRTAFVFPVPDGVDLASRPLVMDVGSRFYFEPEGPGLLASPADETPSLPTDARPDEIDVARAVDALAAATTLEVRGVRRSWAGLRTFAPDRLPVVGFDQTTSGFFWLAGQGGAGIKTAPALAELTRSLIVDGPSRAGASAISPARFRNP